MIVKRLKELLENLPDELEVFIRNSVNICGNIGELEQVEKSFYGFFGDKIPCVILNTEFTDLPTKSIFKSDNEGYIDGTIEYRETNGDKE